MKKEQKTILEDEYGTYSADGKTMLSITCHGTLVVRPTVEDLAMNDDIYYNHRMHRDQLSEVIFSEGCTKIGKGWDVSGYDVIDHDDCTLRSITLPSTIKEVESCFTEFSSLSTVFVPQGMEEYFRSILPKHLAKMVKGVSR